MIQKTIIAVLLIACCSLVSCAIQQKDQGPNLNGFTIVEAFHVCEKCQSMIGGIHGKGPTKSFDGNNSKECVHKWKELDRPTFLRTAEKLYDVDWSKEPAHYWNHDSKNSHAEDAG